MRLGLAALALLSVALSAAAGAAQRPSFSGTWVIVSPEKSAGQEQVVKQDDKMLSLTARGRTVVHQLDGVERKETRAMRGGEIVMLSKAVWEGNTIIITIATTYPNMKTTSREVWSIDAQGRLLIEFTETAENQQSRTVKAILTRKQ